MKGSFFFAACVVKELVSVSDRRIDLRTRRYPILHFWTGSSIDDREQPHRKKPQTLTHPMVLIPRSSTERRKAWSRSITSQRSKNKLTHRDTPSNPMFPCLTVGYGSWFDHVQEFWEHRMDSNVLFLKYEDMYKVRLTSCLVCLVSVRLLKRRHREGEGNYRDP